MTNAYVGLEFYLQLLLTAARGKWVVCFMYQPLCPRYPLKRRRNQSRSWRFGEQIKSLFLPAVEAWFHRRPSHISAAVPTGPLRLLATLIVTAEFNPKAVPVWYVTTWVWCSSIYGHFGFFLSVIMPSVLHIHWRNFRGMDNWSIRGSS
jgi:hypothetical protein